MNRFHVSAMAFALFCAAVCAPFAAAYAAVPSTTVTTAITYPPDYPNELGTFTGTFTLDKSTYAPGERITVSSTYHLSGSISENYPGVFGPTCDEFIVSAAATLGSNAQYTFESNVTPGVTFTGTPVTFTAPSTAGSYKFEVNTIFQDGETAVNDCGSGSEPKLFSPSGHLWFTVQSSPPPPPPTGLQASCTSNTASFNWQPTDGATYYEFRAKDNNTGYEWDLNNVGQPSYFLSGLSGSSYSWWVHACNAAGGCSAPTLGADFSCQATHPHGTITLHACNPYGSSSCITNGQSMNVSPDAHIGVYWSTTDINGNCSYTQPDGTTIGAGNQNPSPGWGGYVTRNPTVLTLACTDLSGDPVSASVTLVPQAAGLPDLTADPVSPPSATLNAPTTLSAAIHNADAPTGASFTDLFEINYGSIPSTFNDIQHERPFSSPALGAGESNQATASFTFTTAGTWYVRACADTNASNTGVVAESNELNNCSPQWRAVTVTDSNGTPTASLTAANMSSSDNAPHHDITVDAGNTVRYVWSSTNGASAKGTYTTDSSECGHSGTGPYDWPSGNTLSGTTDGAIPDCQAGHTYYITYTVTGTNNQTKSDTVTVRVRAAGSGGAPTADIRVTAVNGTAVPNDASTNYQHDVTVHDHDAITVAWVSSNGTSANATLSGTDGLAQNPWVGWLSPSSGDKYNGTKNTSQFLASQDSYDYTYTYAVGGANNQTAQKTATVRVRAGGGTPTASLTITNLGDAYKHDATVNAGDSVAYAWSGTPSGATATSWVVDSKTSGFCHSSDKNDISSGSTTWDANGSLSGTTSGSPQLQQDHWYSIYYRVTKDGQVAQDAVCVRVRAGGGGGSDTADVTFSCESNGTPTATLGWRYTGSGCFQVQYKIGDTTATTPSCNGSKSISVITGSTVQWFVAWNDNQSHTLYRVPAGTGYNSSGPVPPCSTNHIPSPTATLQVADLSTDRRWDHDPESITVKPGDEVGLTWTSNEFMTQTAAATDTDAGGHSTSYIADQYVKIAPYLFGGETDGGGATSGSNTDGTYNWMESRFGIMMPAQLGHTYHYTVTEYDEENGKQPATAEAWITVSCGIDSTQYPQCSPDKNSVLRLDSSCHIVNDACPFATDGFVCVGRPGDAACEMPETPEAMLTVQPHLLAAHSTAKVTWGGTSTGIRSCSVHGSNGDGAGGAWSTLKQVQRSEMTSPIVGQTIYTLDCAPIDPSYAHLILTQTVNIAPQFIEK